MCCLRAFPTHSLSHLARLHFANFIIITIIITIIIIIIIIIIILARGGGVRGRQGANLKEAHTKLVAGQSGQGHIRARRDQD